MPGDGIQSKLMAGRIEYGYMPSVGIERVSVNVCYEKLI
jgi:hypothetical protein